MCCTQGSQMKYIENSKPVDEPHLAYRSGSVDYIRFYGACRLKHGGGEQTHEPYGRERRIIFLAEVFPCGRGTVHSLAAVLLDYRCVHRAGFGLCTAKSWSLLFGLRVLQPSALLPIYHAGQ